MIHVVTHANRSHYEPQLLQMHRGRKAVFIDGKGWKNLKAAANGGEYDKGDDERAIYLLALSSTGEVERSIRFRPTDDWSVLGNVFPHFIGPDEAPITNPDVWEATRYCALGNSREDDSYRRRGEFNVAILEIAVQYGITRIVAISELALIGGALRSGAPTRVIGLPGVYDEGEAVAVETHASLGAVEDIKERLNIHGAVVLEFGDDHPLAELGPVHAAQFLDAVQHLTPASRTLVTGIARAIAKIEAAEGVEAAIDAVEKVREIVVRGQLPATA